MGGVSLLIHNSRGNTRSIKYLVVESMSIEGMVKVYELEEVAQGGKSAFADMIPVTREMSPTDGNLV
jgi:hypothetical protein